MNAIQKLVASDALSSAAATHSKKEGPEEEYMCTCRGNDEKRSRKPLQRNAGTVQSSVYLSLKTERPSPLEGRWIYTTVGSASNGHGQDC